MDNLDKIFEVEEILVKNYNQQKCLSEDEVINCCIMHKLSLIEIDEVCNRLLKRNIIFGVLSNEAINKNTRDRENKKKTITTPKSIHNIQIFLEFPKNKVTLKFALVKFGNNERYDIRNWYDNGEKPGKGLSLTYEEIIRLRDNIKNLDLDAMDFKIRDTYTGGKVSATIYDRICLCSEFSNKGATWNKEVSVVDWGYGLKVDFRKWAADYSVCGKGVAVTFQEAEEIFNCIKEL